MLRYFGDGPEIEDAELLIGISRFSSVAGKMADFSPEWGAVVQPRVERGSLLSEPRGTRGHAHFSI